MSRSAALLHNMVLVEHAIIYTIHCAHRCVKHSAKEIGQIDELRIHLTLSEGEVAEMYADRAYTCHKLNAGLAYLLVLLNLWSEHNNAVNIIIMATDFDKLVAAFQADWKKSNRQLNRLQICTALGIGSLYLIPVDEPPDHGGGCKEEY